MAPGRWLGSSAGAAPADGLARRPLALLGGPWDGPPAPGLVLIGTHSPSLASLSAALSAALSTALSTAADMAARTGAADAAGAAAAAAGLLSAGLSADPSVAHASLLVDRGGRPATSKAGGTTVVEFSLRGAPERGVSSGAANLRLMQVRVSCRKFISPLLAAPIPATLSPLRSSAHQPWWGGRWRAYPGGHGPVRGPVRPAAALPARPRASAQRPGAAQ